MGKKDSQQALFNVGTRVICSHSRSPVEIVSGPNQKGEYQVSLGALTLWIKAKDLTQAPEKNKTGDRSSDAAKNRKKAISERNSQPSSGKSLRIDLHGMTKNDALEQLERALDRGLLEGVDSLEVIHGLGGGILKHAVHQYLASSPHVVSFRLDEKNPGTTWVAL